jgi:hypothetical protein
MPSPKSASNPLFHHYDDIKAREICAAYTFIHKKRGALSRPFLSNCLPFGD